MTLRSALLGCFALIFAALPAVAQTAKLPTGFQTRINQATGNVEMQDGQQWVPIGTLDPVGHKFAPFGQAAIGATAAAAVVKGQAGAESVLPNGAAVARIIAQQFADWPMAANQGVVCNGTTDDAPAINAALSSGRKAVILPDRTCRLGSTVAVPGGVTFQGIGFAPGNPTDGTRLVCDAGVTPCVQMGGNNGTPRLRSIVVDRAGGQPAASMVGVQVLDAYNAIIDDVMVHNQGACFAFLGHAANGAGLGAELTRVFTGACSDVHLDINTWAEIRVSQSRFGQNGTGDFAANTFLRIEGGSPAGSTGSAAGPNTVYMVNSQFNQGSASTKHFVEFANLSNPVPGTDATDFSFDNIHVEGVSSAYFWSDSTWNAVNRFRVNSSTFNDPGASFFALNPATQLSEVTLTGNAIAGSMQMGATSGGTSLNSIISVGNRFGGSVEFDGPSSGGGGTLVEAGNSYASTLKVTGPWGNASIGPDTFVGSGTFTNTGTGNLSIREPGYNLLSGLLYTSGGPQASFGTGTSDQPLTLQGGLSGQSAARISVPGGGIGITIDAPNTSCVQNNHNNVLCLQGTVSRSYVPVGLPSYTVANLPTCDNSQYGINGGLAMVTDAASPTYGAALAGGGSIKTLALCNGSGWVAQ